MAEELTVVYQNQTWKLVPLWLDKKSVGSPWIYKIKTKSDEFIER